MVYSAMDFHSQWLVAHSKTQHPSLRQRPFSLWEKPSNSFLKCNVDAAIFCGPPRMGYGCVLRDSAGLVLGAIHCCLLGIQDPAVAEALGIREALSWLKEQYYPNIIIKSDAKLVVDALNVLVLDDSSLGLAQRAILSCLFSFVYRSANLAAHVLIRAVDFMSDFEGRVSPSPSPSLISDVTLLDSV